jgi:hypothetical protein
MATMLWDATLPDIRLLAKAIKNLHLIAAKLGPDKIKTL